jgi:hypothetical protein
MQHVQLKIKHFNTTPCCSIDPRHDLGHLTGYSCWETQINTKMMYLIIPTTLQELIETVHLV